MKRHLTSLLALLLISAVPALRAQSTPAATTPDTSANSYGSLNGSNEFTLSGSGSGDKHFNHSLGGLDLSLGQFISDTTEILVRQTFNYGGGSSFSTRLALDEHFSTGKLRPFLGVNLGYVYGSAVSNTLAAGLEGGVKYYVHPQTFLFALLDYSFLFRSSNQVSDRFGHGAFFWNVGVGFKL